jgi:hypothetical protein
VDGLGCRRQIQNHIGVSRTSRLSSYGFKKIEATASTLISDVSVKSWRGLVKSFGRRRRRAGEKRLAGRQRKRRRKTLRRKRKWRHLRRKVGCVHISPRRHAGRKADGLRRNEGRRHHSRRRRRRRFRSHRGGVAVLRGRRQRWCSGVGPQTRRRSTVGRKGWRAPPRTGRRGRRLRT